MTTRGMKIAEIEYESISPIKSFAVDIDLNRTIIFNYLNLVQRISFYIYFRSHGYSEVNIIS